MRERIVWLLLTVVIFISVEVSKAQSTPHPRTVEIVNNQPFPVRMPIALRGSRAVGDFGTTTNGVPVQKDGDDLIFVADLPASAVRALKLTATAAKLPLRARSLRLEPVDNGIDVKFGGTDLGTISWEVLYRVSKPGELKGDPFSTKEDFAQSFQPAEIKFERIIEGPVFDTWQGTATKQGLQLSLEVRSFHDGFIDINSSLKNISAQNVENVYAAVLTRWHQGRGRSRTVCYDNRVTQFGERDWTNFRVGASRNWYVQHGVDWLNTNFGNNISVAWLNEFSPSFTVHQNATARRPGRWVGANIPQVGYEAQSSGEDLYMLTEIARPNLKSYAERLEDNRLMNVGESVNFTSRLGFHNTSQTDEQIDNEFIGYTSYAEQTDSPQKIRYSIGVAYTRFGTNYFPYSTLGENFDVKKLPGMDRDGYWPLAADTVKQWQLFAGDIRRDLRIAKTLGFELIRLHHLELLKGVDKTKRFEYLDFLFSELSKLNLKALIDARLSAEDTAELVKRYRSSIDGVEIDNEVLIFGINDDAPNYWKGVYDAVKSAAPEIPVHLTAHTNTGIFDRLRQLGVPFDKIGQHAYSDGLDSLPNMRGFALAAASYGRRAGKPPIITEWNWRFLTRMTPEERAKVYAPIFENVLKTRSIPEIYQFQFNESLAMNPRLLRGIRHYEPMWLSRRPKPEAFVLSDLIDKYSAPDHPNRLLRIGHEVVDLDGGGRGLARFKIVNLSGRKLNLTMTAESASDLKTDLRGSSYLKLNGGESKVINVSLQAAATGDTGELLPGFYHAFLRIEGGGILRYAWAESRLARQPKLDRETKTNVSYSDNAFDFNLNQPLAVVYGDNSPIQDVETAYTVVNALESATGRPVGIFELKDLPKDRESGLILVGTAETNQLIKKTWTKIPSDLSGAKHFVARVSDTSGHDWLILSGSGNVDSERAAMDWTIRFWKYAKDAAAKRVPLIEKELPLGVDPQGLP
ncbi:MAG: hypothetical protein ABJB34_00130 [Acidobacteriota bacterium]